MPEALAQQVHYRVVYLGTTLGQASGLRGTVNFWASCLCGVCVVYPHVEYLAPGA